MEHIMPAQGGSASGGKYFFILGSNPTLSLAELTAIFNQGEFLLAQKNVALLESVQKIGSDIMEKIGGTIKFGLIGAELDARTKAGDLLKPIFNLAAPARTSGKFKFGFSAYGKNKINLKALAMEFKKLLKQTGVSSRWVISREPTLSSVVVAQNKLLTTQGAEIVILSFNKSSTSHGKVLDKKLLLGKTLAVQPFKELSFRDYGRPARDDHSGMLPPKLAQIMINLALPRGSTSKLEIEPLLLDPFCGSGTIITEAMLMGYRNVIGADISNKAVEDTKANIAWTQSKFSIFNFQFSIINSDATKISKIVSLNSIDVIVTEPYLGPQRGWFDINKTVGELERLYAKSLLEFKKILKPNGRIVMVWPIFRGQMKNIFLNPDLAGLKIINPIPLNLRKNTFLKLTDRETIIYGRAEQKIWREIVVLENIFASRQATDKSC